MEDRWLKPRDFNDEEAKEQYKRCLSCKVPMCQTGCPTNMRIRDFIFELKNDNIQEAAKIISECSSLSNICSVVCHHEKQCEGHCVLGRRFKPIPCGHLERYVQNNTSYKRKIEKNIDTNVAIIGAGPAGLAAAKELALNGATVTIFEAENYAGGVMTYGIPSYRLDYSDVLKVVNEVIDLGVTIKFNCKLKESDILKLKENYKYVFVAIGLTNVKKLNINGENKIGVYDALRLLKQSNEFIKLNVGIQPKLDGNVIVVGAGNVAMDAARSAWRLGAKKVTVVYRRSIEEAPASKHEIEDAKNEGVEFKFLTNPVEILGNDHVTGVKCEIMQLSDPDETGRKKPIGSNEFIELNCDYIISAIGQMPENIFDSNKIELNHGYIVGDNLKTNIEGIYTGGDIYLGAQTVVKAMKNGRDFAKIVIENEIK